jgi:hypothetical protein
MLVANDLAATWGISRILGRRVKFRDSGITTEAGEPIPLRTRFRIVYPWFIVGLWTVLTLMIARS